jgi:hypothetical protein
VIDHHTPHRKCAIKAWREISDRDADKRRAREAFYTVCLVLIFGILGGLYIATH